MKIADAVADETSLPFVTAENKFEALVSFHSMFFLSRLVQTDSGPILYFCLLYLFLAHVLLLNNANVV